MSVHRTTRVQGYRVMKTWGHWDMSVHRTTGVQGYRVMKT